MRSLEKEIASVRATPLAGMRVRALVISNLLREDTDNLWPNERIVSAMILIFSPSRTLNQHGAAALAASPFP